jgi:hypothetical protein
MGYFGCYRFLIALQGANILCGLQEILWGESPGKIMPHEIVFFE